MGGLKPSIYIRIMTSVLVTYGALAVHHKTHNRGIQETFTEEQKVIAPGIEYPVSN